MTLNGRWWFPTSSSSSWLRGFWWAYPYSLHRHQSRREGAFATGCPHGLDGSVNPATGHEDKLNGKGFLYWLVSFFFCWCCFVDFPSYSPLVVWRKPRHRLSTWVGWQGLLIQLLIGWILSAQCIATSTSWSCWLNCSSGGFLNWQRLAASDSWRRWLKYSSDGFVDWRLRWRCSLAWLWCLLIKASSFVTPCNSDSNLPWIPCSRNAPASRLSYAGKDASLLLNSSMYTFPFGGVFSATSTVLELLFAPLGPGGWHYWERHWHQLLRGHFRTFEQS